MSMLGAPAAVLRQLDPKRPHRGAARCAWDWPSPPVRHDVLKTQIAGLDLANPVGLAAGFDKNGVAMRAGPGRARVYRSRCHNAYLASNPKPAVRLPEDKAAINRFGFNNEGGGDGAPMENPQAVIGLNLGAKNKP